MGDGGPQYRMPNLGNGNFRYFFCNINVDFQIVQCYMSHLRKGQCVVTNIFPMFLCRRDLRNGQSYVALSTLRVKGPNILKLHFITGRTLQNAFWNCMVIG